MKITREILESHLKCRFKAHLKSIGEQGSSSDYECLMKEARDRVRSAATALLLARHGDAVPRGMPLTKAVLKQGKPLLLDAVLEDDHLALRLDALLRVTGPSSLGDFHYIPVLFHETEKPGRDQKAMLEVLGHLLGPLQGRPPGWGTLMHGQDCNVRRVKLGNGVKQARRTLQQLKELQTGNSPPRLLLNAHCQVCEFRRRCHAEATAKDDLSLLRGIAEKEVNKYGRRGILTVTQLSCTYRLPKRSKRPKPERQPHSHALQALAIREKKIHVLGSPEIPTASVRIFIDLEGDPERGFDYLLGMLVQGEGVEERHSFWADTPADEPRLFQQFLEVIGKHDDFRLYSYGSYEAAFLRRMTQESGKEGLREKVLSRLVNVLSIIHSHVYFPTYSNSLKDIAGYLGFRWTSPDASGIQSIVWRRRWEESGSHDFKELLTTYNREDCAALRKVTEFLESSCPGTSPANGLPAIAWVEEIAKPSTRPEWGTASFAVPDFAFINERAYFDYQRERVYVRLNKVLKKKQARRIARKGKKTRKANRCIVITSQVCPFCDSSRLEQRPDGRLARLSFDLRFTLSGIRRLVTRYTTTWHHCLACGKRFLPRDYLRLEEHCHGLKSWLMFEHVAYRKTLANVAASLWEYFRLPVRVADVFTIKRRFAYYYQATYKRLQEAIFHGRLIHADETEVNLTRTGKGYVWVFTSLEEVVFMYRKSREGDLVAELLKDFRGVVVSDFYGAYDSLQCPQQKCLIHLMRDFNNDIQRNPWDQELKSLASDFGSLLRKIVATVDKYGLKQRHLGKHKPDVEGFFRRVEGQVFRSEIAEGYQSRLVRHRSKLFTFLDYDGVPWNNNNAEHAVKQFAYYREIADGRLSESGLQDYLVLLSIRLTCKYKGISFLRFLLSRETDLGSFEQSNGDRHRASSVELHAEGMPLFRPSRKQTWNKEAKRNDS